MLRTTLAFAVLSTLVLSTAACNSALDPSTGSVAASQGAGIPAASGDSLPQVTSGSDDPATHDVADDNGGLRGDNGSGRGGADDS